MDSTERFSDRVANYILHRPGYPKETAATVLHHFKLSIPLTVADIGSGTGLLAQNFISAGCDVIGVEPNDAMRNAGDELVKGAFQSFKGTAENTGLAGDSVDLIIAGQAFHWFDANKAKAEFIRIGKKRSPVALIWNDRLLDSSDFMRAYEKFLQRYATDYNTINHQNLKKEAFDRFFGPENWSEIVFPNTQVFDFNGLLGRLESSSYIPTIGSPENKIIREESKILFDNHKVNNTVRFEYQTRIYLGYLIN